MLTINVSLIKYVCYLSIELFKLRRKLVSIYSWDSVLFCLNLSISQADTKVILLNSLANGLLLACLLGFIY